MELLDGTLKLRHCTTLFTMRFPPWSLPRVGNGGGKRQCITPGLPTEAGGNLGNKVRLTKKARPGVFSRSNPDPGHPTPRRGKDCAPFPPKEWEVRWACLAIFFLALVLGEVLHWGCLEPAFGRNRHRGFPAGQSSRRDQCTGTGPFQLDALCMRMDRHPHVTHHPHHHHNHHHHPHTPPPNPPTDLPSSPFLKKREEAGTSTPNEKFGFRSKTNLSSTAFYGARRV